MADDADEVKVFQSPETDDCDQQTSDQLVEDKKDVVLEAELESRPQDIGSNASAFRSPGFPPGMAMPPFSPSYLSLNLMMLGGMRPQMAPMSPSFMNFMPMHMPMLSPNYMNMMNLMGPTSPAFAAYNAMAANMSRAGNPLAQMNQMRLPVNGSPMMSVANSQEHYRKQRDKKKDDHVKKPLNAFMWFMKENRPKISNELEFKEKQSAELNKELGKRWHDLPKEEQQKYFEMAKKDREMHKERYPNWSARENYAVHKKKKRRRDKTEDSAEMKKCRARFGTSNQDKWCNMCRRKKKCINATSSYPPSDGTGDMLDRMSASGSSGPSPLTSSMGGPSPLAHSPHSDSASESDMDADDVDDDEEERTIVQSTIHEIDMKQEGLQLI